MKKLVVAVLIVTPCAMQAGMHEKPSSPTSLVGPTHPHMLSPLSPLSPRTPSPKSQSRSPFFTPPPSPRELQPIATQGDESPDFLTSEPLANSMVVPQLARQSPVPTAALAALTLSESSVSGALSSSSAVTTSAAAARARSRTPSPIGRSRAQSPVQPAAPTIDKALRDLSSQNDASTRRECSGSSPMSSSDEVSFPADRDGTRLSLTLVASSPTQSARDDFSTPKGLYEEL